MKPLTPYNFFLKHAGWSYDPLKETSEQGRRRCAKRLAQAEKWAKENDYFFRWELDGRDSSEWISANEDGGKNHNPWQTWGCILRDSDHKVCQSLGGIDFGRDGEPWNDPYKRVVEAELALEEMCATDKELAQ